MTDTRVMSRKFSVANSAHAPSKRDEEAVRAFDAALARGEEELVPAAVVDRLLAGEPRLKVWREYRRFTQTTLAAASGVHRVVVADIESGRKRSSLDAHVKLARALGLLVDDLIVPPADDAATE